MKTAWVDYNGAGAVDVDTPIGFCDDGVCEGDRVLTYDYGHRSCVGVVLRMAEGIARIRLHRDTFKEPE